MLGGSLEWMDCEISVDRLDGVVVCAIGGATVEASSALGLCGLDISRCSSNNVVTSSSESVLIVIIHSFLWTYIPRPSNQSIHKKTRVVVRYPKARKKMQHWKRHKFLLLLL